MAAEDEARAAAYRAQMVARARNKKAAEAALAGDPAAAEAVREAWAPLLPLNSDGVPRIGRDAV